MSIFDIFRKKKLESVKSKLPFEELGSFSDEKLKELDNRSLSFRKELMAIKNQFSSDIKNILPSLRLINLDKKREAERLKEVVMENMSAYILQLEKLSEDLDKIDDKETKEYLQEIEKRFNVFAKNSRANFERATILIGKELDGIKHTVAEFAEQINEKIKANAAIFEKIRLITDLKSSLAEMNEIKDTQAQLSQSANNIKNKLAHMEEEKKSLELGYKKYTESSEYSEFLERCEIINKDNKSLNESLLKIKQAIDFKLLLKYFHNDKKKSRAIKDYSENFIESLKNDHNLELIRIIKEANMIVNENTVAEARNKLLCQRSSEENPKIREFTDKIKRLEHDIAYEKNNLEQEELKKQKFVDKYTQAMKKIKEKSEKIWPELILEI